MKGGRRALRAATPPVAGAKTLPRLETAADDPVLAALARIHGVTIYTLPGEAIVDHTRGQDSRFPDDMPQFTFGPAGDRYSGQALVHLRHDPYVRYIRNLGGARIQVDGTMLPATVAQGAAGLPVHRIINVPGLEDWVVSHVGWDTIAERYEIFVVPTPPGNAS